MARLRSSIIVALGVAAVVAGSLPGSAAARHGLRSHAAIVGGTTAPAGTWPWLAYIVDNLGNGSYEACTGTVVAPNLVLTAAHCVETLPGGVLDDASGFYVVTGSLDWTDSAARQVSAVTEVISHATSTFSGTNGTNIIGDAGLLVLATPTTAPPITLASSSDLSLVNPGTGGDLAGWGLTSAGDATSTPAALQEGPTVIQAATFCSYHLATFNSAAQLCSVDAPDDTATTCHGDSGGPLVTQAPNATWIQVGITSSGLNNCDPTVPGYFTRVDYVDAWVQSWIAALPPRAATPVPVPVSTPTPTPAAPAQPAPPQIGNYHGTSNQHRGHLGLTDATGGLIRVHLEFNLHCPRGRRGPFIVTETWSSSAPLTLSVVAGALGFSTAFNDKDGWHYTITGRFATLGTATGTLKVTTRNAQCTTGLVSWTSSTPTA